MARIIDSDAVLDRYYAEFEQQDICDGSEDRDWLMKCLAEAPTLTQPNEPLTLDDLRDMDGQPVWVEELNCWALVDLMYLRGDELLMVLFDDGDVGLRNVERCNLHCYRRPPEGKTDA